MYIRLFYDADTWKAGGDIRTMQEIPEEILKRHFEDYCKAHPADNWISWEDAKIEGHTDFTIAAMMEYAHQETAAIREDFRQMTEARDTAKARVLSLLEEVNKYREAMLSMQQFMIDNTSRWADACNKAKEVFRKYTPKDKEA